MNENKKQPSGYITEQLQLLSEKSKGDDITISESILIAETIKKLIKLF
ncbi:hypothetical protein [Ruoffia tabacinasalis]|uniref:Uncharacterized protein n=1 Tax=Ruoffia tabacinasalis TaxID=87458 RepID=A0ABS0LGX5_9LACT|nr:hypothetical protein [Ruoffia tabacinasalis]MBG9977262.1 hypothetical protein [Ruoffia tabacinasalis]